MFLKIALIVLIGIEVFVMNTSYIENVIASGLEKKIIVFFTQAIFHSAILFFILKLFLKNKRDSLNFKLSLLFFVVILFFGGFRILLSLTNLSGYETWVIYITKVYHLLRSPNVFAIIIPLLIVRKQFVYPK